MVSEAERKELVELVRKLVAVAMDSPTKQDEFITLAIRGTHNTEEQRLFKLIHRLIVKRAESDSYVDGRNEAAQKWCVKVAAIEAYFPFI